MADNLKVEDDQLSLLDAAKVPEVKVEVEAEDPIAALKAQIAQKDSERKAAIETAEAERRGRIEAEQRVAQRDQEVVQYKSQAVTAEQQAVASAIDAVNREIESAEQEAEASMNLADYKANAKANAKMAKAAARLAQLEIAKAHADAQATQHPSAEGRVERQQNSDPTETFLSSFSPRSQGWLREHRDVIDRDGYGRPKLNAKVMSAHYAAEAAGIKPDTDEYFQTLESHLAPKQQAEDDAPAQQASRRGPVAAPVSRDPPSNGGQVSPSKVKLSPAEAEAAEISGLTPLQYWQNKQALTAEGKMGRTTH